MAVARSPQQQGGRGAARLWRVGLLPPQARLRIMAWTEAQMCLFTLAELLREQCERRRKWPKLHHIRASGVR